MANKKIEIYLHGYHLGTLAYDREKDLYSYNSNLKEEEKFKTKHRIELVEYNLWGSKDFQTSQMPRVFLKDVENMKNRNDILKGLKLPEKPVAFEEFFHGAPP